MEYPEYGWTDESIRAASKKALDLYAANLEMKKNFYQGKVMRFSKDFTRFPSTKMTLVDDETGDTLELVLFNN